MRRFRCLQRARCTCVPLILVVLALVAPAYAQAPATTPPSAPGGQPPRARVALEETLDAPIAFVGEARAADALPVAARITLPHAALADERALARLDARTTTLLARDVAVWLAIESAPPTAEALEAWSAAIAALTNRFGTR